MPDGGLRWHVGLPGLIETLADLKHPDHEDLADWIGSDFDRDHFEVAGPGATTYPGKICATGETSVGESGGGEIVVGEVLVVDRHASRYHVVSVVGDPVVAGAWELGDESVAAEFDDES